MAIKLDPLPYNYNALEPLISEETLQFHHDKHHKKYVDTLNGLITGTKFEHMQLHEIVLATAPKEPPAQHTVFDPDADDGVSPDSDELRQKIFDNAAQAWNHAFYWLCLAPAGKSSMPDDLKEAIDRDFGSVAVFKKLFKKAAAEQFGSGWAWLVLDGKQLAIAKTGNAENPLPHKQQPLLTVDVWEHAYYLDYQNKRPDYLEAVVEKLINWEFVAQNLRGASGGMTTAKAVAQ